MITNMHTDRVGLRSRRSAVSVVVILGLIGTGAYLAGVHRQHTRSAPTQVITPQRQQVARQTRDSRQQEARRRRRAMLVQKINRYWRLREEAVERGIDVSRIPVMPFIVGPDGNIYRILPDGHYQFVPDDQFRDPAPRGI